MIVVVAKWNEQGRKWWKMRVRRVGYQLSSASIFDHTLKSFTTHSFSSSLLLYSFFDLVGVSKSASTTTADLCWKWLETIRFRSSFFDLEALLSTPGTIPLEGFYLGLVISRQVFFFFGVWSLGNCEWSFCDCGVWSLWLNCEWSFCVKLWLWWWQNEMSKEENGGKWGWGG